MSEDHHCGSGSPRLQHSEMTDRNTDVENMFSPSVSSHKRTPHALSGLGILATWGKVSRCTDAEVDAYTVRSSNEHMSVVCRQDSTSSADDKNPLLPVASEQPGSPTFLMPEHQTHQKGWNTSANLISPIQDAWTHVTRRFHYQTQVKSKGNRRVRVDVNRTSPLTDERSGMAYPGNSIRSNRYTPYTFFPRQLFAQFSKLANFYFLCFAVMQLIPGLSTTGNYTNIIPLMIFVSISVAKEGYDDYRRHLLYKNENCQQALVLDSTTPLRAGTLNWHRTQWRHLKVGDVIQLIRNGPVPADIVLLGCRTTREPNVTHVETTALDGETSLKRKQVLKCVAEACSTPEDLVSCSVEFVAEDPNPDLSTFKGNVTVNGQTSPLSNNGIIYRGSVFRHTEEAIAMIVYTGEECRIRMNINGDGPTRVKALRLQSMLNKIVLFVVGIVVALSIYNTLAYQVWKADVETKLFYLSSAVVPFHQEVFGFIIMFGTMVPLSLYVSMEMIKLAQIYFLNADIEMYDERSDTPFESRTSTINEEMEQVTHVFSDKTCTLTNNEMKFRKLYVAGTEWIHESASALTASLETRSTTALAIICPKNRTLSLPRKQDSYCAPWPFATAVFRKLRTARSNSKLHRRTSLRW